MKMLILIPILCIICSCNNTIQKNKYTVWIGTSAFAVGYDTDTVKSVGNNYEFINQQGKNITVSKSNVNYIEQN